MDVPDFRDESSRKQVEDDTYSPFPARAELGYKGLPPSILGTPKPSERGLANARRIWEGIGYRSQDGASSSDTGDGRAEERGHAVKATSEASGQPLTMDLIGDD